MANSNKMICKRRRVTIANPLHKMKWRMICRV
jgi:hypothetical protein